MVKKFFFVLFLWTAGPALFAQGVPFDTLKLTLGNSKEAVLKKLTTYGQVLDGQGAPLTREDGAGEPILAVENIMTAAGCMDLQFWFTGTDRQTLTGIAMSPSSTEADQVGKFRDKYVLSFVKKWGEGKTVQMSAKNAPRQMVKTEWSLEDGRRLVVYDSRVGDLRQCNVAYADETSLKLYETALQKAKP